ncbi:TPA: protein kinase [Legionella pneumophila]|nr:protein kinase [Legionella pneumophila]
MSRTMFFSVDAANLQNLQINNQKAFAALESYLNDNDSPGAWNNNQGYKYTHKDITYCFSFNQSLVRRPRKSDQKKHAFEIFDPNKNPLGKGGYGIVYPILGTIQFEFGNVIKRPQKNKLVKIQNHSYRDQSHSVLREYQGLLQSGHIAVKPPVFVVDKESKFSYLIMEKADGTVLEKFLNPVKRLDLSEEIPELNLIDRIEITFAILKAIKEQVTDKHLIHRDIKPGNIIIDFSKSPPIAKVIDFGFVLRESEQDYHRCGTRAYRAPESFNTQALYTAKADVWSTGRILSYLWGDKYTNYYISRDKGLDYVVEKSRNDLLFSEPELELYLTNEDKSKIRASLNAMLVVNPEERVSIDEAIKQFSRIDFEKYKRLKQFTNSELDLTDYDIKLKKQVNVIHLHLITLQRKEKDLRDRECFDAANAMSRLVSKLTTYTNYLEKNPAPFLIKRYQDCCIKEIDLANLTLKNHRDALWLVAELSTAILLLGVGYLFAFGINYYYTSRLGLFSQTRSEKMVEEMKSSVLGIVAGN